MRIICADAETYFADDFTLSKMTTESYIRDKRFECHGWAVKWGPDHEPKWYDDRQARYIFAQEDWSDTAIICHHAQFDGLILSHHYGIKPKFYLDTLSCARLLLGNHLSVGLDALAKHYGLAAKTVPYSAFRGRHWNELSQAVQQQVAEGACHDVDLTWQLFKKLGPQIPKEEFMVMDTVIRMFVNPVLRADTEMLARIWEREEHGKAARLKELGVEATDLASSEKFAVLLRAEGVEPETKDGKKGPIYCFAKTDPFMEELREHDEPRVRALAEARLGEKSTLMQTRANTLGWMDSRGPLCVYLKYAGAGTLRVSGGDGANWLNFKRGSDMRKAILAPEGCLLAPVDASQIEFRVCMYLAGQEDVLEQLRNGEDPYLPLACEFYGEKIYKPGKDDPRRLEMEQKRGTSKQANLMCLGPSTEVLTSNGIKAIIDVQKTDLLWDGVEWVKHSGLIYRGERHVENYSGVTMTSDHLVLCDQQVWLPAACLRNESILCRALAAGSAHLPLSGLNSEPKAGLKTSSLNVRATVPNIQSIRTICMQVVQRIVLLAPGKFKDIIAKSIWDMLTFARTTIIELGSWGASLLFTTDANRIQNIMHMPITEDVVSRFVERGKIIEQNFLATSSPCPDGTTQYWKSIESKIKKGIAQEILGLPRDELTTATGVNLENSNKKLPTYDISYAGPRHRFTILSNRGPLIVHNCIYGAAGAQFQKTARVGLYGPSVKMTIEDAERFVKLFRDTHPKVCDRKIGYWAQAEVALRRLAEGSTMQWGPLTIKDHRIYLPAGQPLIYDTLEWRIPGPDEEVKEWETKGFWRMRTRHGWKKMWGSKLVQNICEAVSRVIVSQAMNRITAKGFRVLNWPYDELLILVDNDGHQEQHVQDFLAEFRKTPEWLPGIPLDAEAGLGERYSK